MEFRLKNIGAFGGRPASIIELTISSDGAEITKEVTDLHGNIDEGLIMELRELADELEEQNNKLAECK